MTLDIIQNEKKITLAIEGNLDNNTSPEFQAKFNESTADAEEVVLDLKKLDYLSSAGLRVIITAQKTMNKKGKMTIVNVPPFIMDIFDLTGLSRILNIAE